MQAETVNSEFTCEFLSLRHQEARIHVIVSQFVLEIGGNAKVVGGLFSGQPSELCYASKPEVMGRREALVTSEKTVKTEDDCPLHGGYYGMKHQRPIWLSLLSVIFIAIVVPIGVLWGGVIEKSAAFRKLPSLSGYTQKVPSSGLDGAVLEPLRIGRSIGRTTFVTGTMGRNKPAYSKGTVYAIAKDPSHRFVWVVSYPNTNFQLGMVQTRLERKINSPIPFLPSLKYSKAEVVRSDVHSPGKLRQPVYKVLAVVPSRLIRELVSSWKNGAAAITPLGGNRSFLVRLQSPSLPGLGVILFGSAYSPTEAYLSNSMGTKFVRLNPMLSRWIWKGLGSS